MMLFTIYIDACNVTLKCDRMVLQRCPRLEKVASPTHIPPDPCYLVIAQFV